MINKKLTNNKKIDSKKIGKNIYDLIIIGAGQAGNDAAQKANDLKIKTLLVNAGLPYGGTCLNVGCVPSKRLLYAGELLHTAQKQILEGINLKVEKFDFKKVIKSMDTMISGWRQAGLEGVKKLKYVTYLEGWASFVSPHEVQINKMVYTGTKILIATGSTALAPNIQNIHEVGFITHIQALYLNKIPKSMVIIGGGAIGLELGQAFGRFGTKVTILEFKNEIIPQCSKELTDQLIKLFAQENIQIKTGVAVTAVKKAGKEKAIFYKSADNITHKISAEEILIAAGKIPNTQKLNLDKAGVEIEGKHGIKVNKYLQTSQPHIFAVGDVINSPLRIESTASYEGPLAIENAFLNTKKTIDYSSVPFALFTDPQLAIVGLLEGNIPAGKKDNYSILTASFGINDKANIINRTEGLMKMIVHKASKEIHGIQILSPQAADMINQAMLIIKNKNSINDVLDSLSTFPTLSRTIRTLAANFKQT
ncbi:mercury(II) reductase [soil metagenome]